jgi:hypothetical protein
MSTIRQTKTYDDLLCLHEWGTALTASDYGSDEDDTAIVLDLGSGLFEGDVIVDVSALDVDTGNEKVDLFMQLSDVAACASAQYDMPLLQLGDATQLGGDTDITTGRYVRPFNNMIANGACKRYCRLHIVIAGTVSGFSCLAYIGKTNR